MANVCLTVRQKEIYDYFVSFYKANGVFPSTSEAARHLNTLPTTVQTYVGALFLKGAFTEGKPLTNTYRVLHGKETASFNIGKRTFNSTPVGRTRRTTSRLQATPAAPAARPAVTNEDIINALRSMFQSAQ